MRQTSLKWVHLTGLAALFILFYPPLIPARSQTATLKAGAARVDITPPPGVDLWGYGDRSGPATGTLDPLYARILLLDDGRKTAALVTLDLGRTFGQAQIKIIRDRAKQEHRVGDVIFMASHTHSGPNIDEDYEIGGLPAWERRAIDKIVIAIGEARARLVPARIGAGFGQTIIGHNRRVTQTDGTVKMLWRNTTGETTAPIDPVVGVIRIDDARGAPLAILVHYACHPVVFGPDNLRYSADYPGAMARTVEASWPGRPLCFFLQGAAGDINPMFDKTPLAENADGEMKRVGAQIGREVARVSRTIVTEATATPEIAVLTEEMSFKNRWNLEKLKTQLVAAYGPRLVSRHQRYLADPIVAPVTTLLINRQIALVGLPGEPFVGLQISLKQRSPLPFTFLCGYTNGYIAYFPTIREAVRGGYGADSITTRVEIGAGERMIDRGLIHIYRLLGKL
jgi:neutral ceramidase